MAYNTIIVDRCGENECIGRITLNRPEKLNALSGELLGELESALADAAWDDEIRVIVLRGSGRGFGAGYDLAQAHGSTQRRSRLTGFRREFQMGARRQLFLFNLPKVTIAQIHGYCLAGSCEYAMMADLVVAAEDARIGHPGIRGLGHPRNTCGWPLIMGMRKTKELLYTGDQISGVEAEACGMINKAVPAAELESEVLQLAQRIANQSADALAVQKEATNRWYQAMGMESSVMAAADYDLLYQSSECAAELQTKIQEEGLKEAFTWRDTRYGDLRGKS